MRAIVFAVVIVMSALQAHAADDVTAQAKKAFQAGTAAFDAKKYDEALADYQEAYRLKPLPGFLFNIGLCHRKLGHHDAAATFFERYLNAEPNAKNKADVQAMLDEERRLSPAKPADAPAPAPAPAPPVPAVAPLQPEAAAPAPAVTTTDAKATTAATGSEASSSDATPWLVGGGVGVVVAAVAATAVVVVVATSKPAPIGTIDLRGATP